MKTFTTFTRSTMLALAALSIQVSVSSAARAETISPSGSRLCENGMGTPDQFAGKTEAAIARDATGKKFTLAGCKVTPYLLLVGFQHTTAGKSLKSVQELPAFIRRLKAMDVDRNAEYVTSALWDTSRGREFKPDVETRGLRDGEVVYGDPETGELLVMSSCANIGVKFAEIVVTASCIPVHFPSMGAGTAVRLAVMNTSAVSARCLTLDTSDARKFKGELPDECPMGSHQVIIDGRKANVSCSWDEDELAASRSLGHAVKVTNITGSFKARQDGNNVLMVPRAALESGMLAICWEWETMTGNSKALGVTLENIRDGKIVITPEMVRNSNYAGN